MGVLELRHDVELEGVVELDDLITQQDTIHPILHERLPEQHGLESWIQFAAHALQQSWSSVLDGVLEGGDVVGVGVPDDAEVVLLLKVLDPLARLALS